MWAAWMLKTDCFHIMCLQEWWHAIRYHSQSKTSKVHVYLKRCTAVVTNHAFIDYYNSKVSQLLCSHLSVRKSHSWDFYRLVSESFTVAKHASDIYLPIFESALCVTLKILGMRLIMVANHKNIVHWILGGWMHVSPCSRTIAGSCCFGWVF